MSIQTILRRATGAVVSVVVAWGAVNPTPLTVSATELEPGFVTSIPAPSGVTVGGPWAMNSARGDALGWGVDDAGYSVVLRHTLATGTITAARTAVTGDGTARIVHSHASTGMAYVVTQRTTPGDRIIAVDQSSLARTAAYTLGSAESSVTTFATGSAGNVGYVTTGSNPTKILRLATPALTLLSSATMPTGIGAVTASTLYGGYLWLFTGSNPVKLVAVNPTSLAVVSTTPLDGVVAGLTSLSLVGSVAYLGSETGVGRIVAVDLATASVVGSVTLGADEQGARLGFMDPTTGMLSVATTTTTGTRLVTVDTATLRVVGRSLADAAGTPTAVYGNGRYVYVGTAAGPTAISVFTRSPAPAAPTGLTVASADGAVAVSWTAAASDEPVTGYEAVAEGPAGASMCRATGTGCTIAGLANGSMYRITVTAHSIAGVGGSATAWATPFTVPDGPINPDVARGNSSVTAHWVAPGDGGSAITEYRVVARDANGAEWECRTSGLTCDIAGLTNGTGYAVSVVATNAAGDSVATPAGTVTPATVPTAARDIVVNRGDGVLHVAWTGPADDGGDPVVSFDVVALQGNDIVVARCDGGSMDTSCVLTGLTNGLPYSVRVLATNTVGSGPAAHALGTFVPAREPDAPSGVTITRGDRTLGASWTSPSDTGGVPLDGYRVIAAAPDGTETVCRTQAPTCTVTGLINGLDYRVWVVAVNEVGASLDAEAAGTARPATTPGRPGIPEALAADQRIDVSWAAPESDGGEPVLGYRALAVDSAGLLVGICDAATTGCTITGLSNGSAVTVTVIAHTAVGDGLASSASAPITPATVPAAPTSVVAVRGNGIITATWSAPMDDGGSVVTGYRVTAQAAGRSEVACTASVPRCVLAGLTNGTAYRVQVTALNAMGAGTASNLTAGLVPAGPPSAPRYLTVTTKNSRQVALRWRAPVKSNGEPVVDYTVQWSTRKTSGFVPLRDPRSAVTTASFTRPRTGVTLYLRVIAVNRVGKSVATTAIRVPAR